MIGAALICMKFLILILLIVSFNGCSTGPTINTSAQNTPIGNPEAKVLFVDLLRADWSSGSGESANDEEREIVSLKASYRNTVGLHHGHQIVSQDDKPSKEQVEEHDLAIVKDDDIINKGSKFAVIINGVWIPDLNKANTGSSKTRDIAVILDIVTQDGLSEPLVVAYQRGITGGYLMNFKNLLVYYTDDWDGIKQPFFRVRLLDVTSERKENAQALLEDASKAMDSVSGMIPSAYIPYVSSGIKTAQYILGNAKNKILMDYKIQFYVSGEKRGYLNDSLSQTLDTFAQGSWIALARPKDMTSEFWRGKFVIDRRTGEIGQEIVKEHSACMETNNANPDTEFTAYEQVPYVSVIIVKGRTYGIANSIQKSFNELYELIQSGESRTDYSSLSSIGTMISDEATNIQKEKIDVLKVDAIEAALRDDKTDQAKLYLQELLDSVESEQDALTKEQRMSSISEALHIDRPLLLPFTLENRSDDAALREELMNKLKSRIDR